MHVERSKAHDEAMERFQQKCAALLRPKPRQNSNLERNGDSKNSHFALDRRTVLGIGALAMAVPPLRVHAGVSAVYDTIPLWPSMPPGGEDVSLDHETVHGSLSPALPDRHISGIARPTLSVFWPAAPNGSAFLIIPGGGYAYETFDKEGIRPALDFAERGITSFVLTYRLPREGWKDARDVPLQDAQRAMRLIRARGPRDYAIDPERVGVLGFSAGGHLAGSLATRFDAQTYTPVDEADAFDACPSFAALLYPVITMLPPYAHEASREKLLGTNAPLSLRAAYSVERAVSPRTPSCFLVVAADDPDVPIDNTLSMFASLRSAGIPSEMHVFEKGRHGFGVDIAGKPAGVWPELLLRWGAAHGFFGNP